MDRPGLKRARSFFRSSGPKVILPPGERDNSPDARARKWVTRAGSVAFLAVCAFLLYKAVTLPPPVYYPPPRIEAFVASGNRGGDGSWHVLLTWSTTNADDVQIEPGIGKVEPEGRRTLQIQKDTVYTMTAKGKGGVATHELEVQVTAP